MYIRFNSCYEYNKLRHMIKFQPGKGLNDHYGGANKIRSLTCRYNAMTCVFGD